MATRVPAPRWPARLLIALLLVDAALALVAIQASFVFLEIVWRALAGRDDWSALLAQHARQFARLRALQAVGWGATVLMLVTWLRGVRARLAADGRLVRGAPPVRPFRLMLETWRASVPARRARRVPPLLGWWWALILITLGAESWALVRLLAAGTNLELGRGLLLVVLASAAGVGAAALGVFVVVAMQAGATAPSAAPR
jgi:hypothetical protein